MHEVPIIIYTLFYLKVCLLFILKHKMYELILYATIKYNKIQFLVKTN